jgi:hypothetical protein
LVRKIIYIKITFTYIKVTSVRKIIYIKITFTYIKVTSVKNFIYIKITFTYIKVTSPDWEITHIKATLPVFGGYLGGFYSPKRYI